MGRPPGAASRVRGPVGLPGPGHADLDRWLFFWDPSIRGGGPRPGPPSSPPPQRDRERPARRAWARRTRSSAASAGSRAPSNDRSSRSLRSPSAGGPRIRGRRGQRSLISTWFPAFASPRCEGPRPRWWPGRPGGRPPAPAAPRLESPGQLGQVEGGRVAPGSPLNTAGIVAGMVPPLSCRPPRAGSGQVPVESALPSADPPGQGEHIRHRVAKP